MSNLVYNLGRKYYEGGASPSNLGGYVCFHSFWMILEIVVIEAQKMPTPMAHPIAPLEASPTGSPNGTRQSKATRHAIPAHAPNAQNMIGNAFIGCKSIAFENSLKIMRPPFLFRGSLIPPIQRKGLSLRHSQGRQSQATFRPRLSPPPRPIPFRLLYSRI